MAAEYDVAVLGAGAAGLVAAARAAECGARVILLEKNRRAGVKILISGRHAVQHHECPGPAAAGRGHRPDRPGVRRRPVPRHRAIQQAFGPNGAFLGPSLRRLDVDATIRLFEQAGVATKVEGNGKVFPASDRAVDVLDALLRRLEHSGASLRCQCPVMGIEPIGVGPGDSPGFAVRLPDSTIAARRVIVTVGGRSYPGCGTTGDGYAIARRLGHAIVEPRPALVPMRVDADWVGRPPRRHPARRRGLGPRPGRRLAARPARGRALRPLRPDRPGDPRRQPGRGTVRRSPPADACGWT